MDIDRVFAAGGEVGAVMRSIDWAATPIGPVETWTHALRTMVGLLLRNHSPMLLWWGPKFVQLYNDAYRPVPGDKHPRAMGQPASECWAEIWHIIGPMIEAPFRGEPATTSDDLELYINRRGFVEETHFIVAYSPVPDETVPDTGIGGVLATVTEITQQVYGERQLRTLRELGARAAEANTAEAACTNAAATLAQNGKDVPFSRFYLFDDATKQTRLAARVGNASDEYPIGAVLERREVEVFDGAIALPLASPDQPEPYGVLVCGLSPHRLLDAGYRTFFELAAAQVVTAIRNARAYQTERKRAESLAEIDRAKTTFFSNVSHEFRTPLTLMLGPVEDALADTAFPLSPPQRERFELVHRNGLRLQKLVNTLLDFSRIEAGRSHASYAPIDLASATIDLASTFRSAIENAGLRLVIDCSPLPEPIWVDPSMWEKIVLNLVSNAFKFTFEGEVRVALSWLGDRAELSVADTGTGIPAEDLPHVFERFRRVEGARGRSQEGSGIGLALVRELVGLHGGHVDVESTAGHGSIFRVTLPSGNAHLPKDRVVPDLQPTNVAAPAFLAEVAQWSREQPSAERPSDARILVADDNADMREYVTRLLAPHWRVESVCDGVEALEAARLDPPDLVLSDVMMPRMDGLELIRQLRSDPRTQTIPIVLLSARAGEESTIHGLKSGADEYLVKPFSAKELLARVNAQLAVSKLRRESERAAEEHATRANELLAQTRHALEARDRMAAIVSHDLRSPLATIDMAVHLLERHAGDNRAVVKQVGAIRRAAATMTHLIGDLLDVASIESGTLTVVRAPVRVEELVRETSDAFHAVARDKGVSFRCAIEPDLPPLDADRQRILQALANLVTNAIKFTEAGGHVDLDVRRIHDHIELSVTDTGSGIAPDELAHIFDPHWRQAQSTQQGYGLGLSIVKGIVEAHDGTIRVRSTVGRGSRFELSLPIRAQTRPASTKPQRPRDASVILSARDAFVGIASHELRTPLTALEVQIESALDIVLRRTSDERLPSKLRVALRQVDRLTRLIDALLDVSRISMGRFELQREECDLATLVQRALAETREDANAAGSIIHAELESARGSWDRARLERVLLNLVSNAVKYAPGTRIDVAVRAAHTEAVVTVRDRGIGIRSEDIGRIFERFERAVSDAHYGGLGLGLYLARQVAQAHGGSLEAESAYGRGATFTMRLPMMTEAS